jgi:RHS repeat-associated protein
MFRQRRLTWLAIAALLLQSAAPALTSLRVTAFAAAPPAYESHVVKRGPVLPSTQELLGTTDQAYTEPVYTAPNPADENGPLQGNGTFRLADDAVSPTNVAANTPSKGKYIAEQHARSTSKKGVSTYSLSVSGTISANTTWATTDSPILVTSTVTVASPATLTIQPGVIVKFAAGTGLTINDSATLNAIGTSSSRIIFTSIKDDVGGDDNGDGTATTPAAGDWAVLNYNGYNSGSTCFSAAGSLKFADVRYGQTAQVRCSSITVTDDSFTHMSGYGLTLMQLPASGPVYDRLTITDNTRGLSLYSVPSTDTLQNSVLRRSTYEAVNATTSSAMHLLSNAIEGNSTGGSVYAIYASSSALYLRNNAIAKNFDSNGTDRAITSTGSTVDATSNFFGSTTGPEVSGQTNTGGGAMVSTLVTTTSWLGNPYQNAHKNGVQPWSTKLGQGVDAATGNFTWQEKDFSIATMGFPLEMVRTYNNKTADTDGGDFGNGWACTYCQNLNLSDSQGAAWQRTDGTVDYFKKNPDNSFDAENGVFETMTYDPSTTTYTVTSKDQTQLVFNTAGKLVKQIDTDGNTTTIARDASNRPTTVTAPDGRQLTFTYSGNYISKIVDPLGRSYNYSQGTLSTKTTTIGVVKKDAANTTYATSTYGFTTSVSQMTSMSDGDGNILSQTFDSSKRVTSQTWNGNASIRFVYGPATDATSGLTIAANSTAMFDALGYAHIAYYTQSAKVYEVDVQEAGGGGLWFQEDRWTYANFTTTSHTDIENNTDQQTVDWKTGNVLSKTIASNDATGKRTTTYTYDPFNNKKSETDNLGRQTLYDYDSEQHLTKVTDALTRETTTAYFANGLPQTVTDARGHTTSFTYDTYGYPATVTNGAGEVMTFSFDVAGRKLWEKDPQLHQTTYTYNARDEVLTVTDPLLNITTTTYDSAGRKLTVTDPEGRITTYAYTAARNALATTTDAKSGVVTFTLDAYGNLANVKDALNHQTTFTYDQFNRRVTEKDANNKTTTTVYTDGGRVWKVTDANSQLTTYTYNHEYDLTNVAYADSKTVANTFDGVGNRLTMVDWLGTHTYTYDALNRVLTDTNPSSQTISYAFDEVGNLATLTYPGSLAVSYTYDNANRLLTVTDWASRVTTYNYDTNGRMGGFALPNGVVTTYGYDADSHVSHLDHATTGGTIASFDYTFDKLGNRKTKVTPTGTESYLYDELYRITNVTYPNTATASYTYDATGNRLSKTDGSIATNYSYDVADQLLNAGDGVRTYDNDGQLTKVGSHLGYTWDARQQLAAITDSPTNAAPTANAGADQTGYVNRLVFLDGSSSTDPEGESLRYTWTESSGNPAVGLLQGAHTAKPGFIATVAGTYTFTLTVNDGRADSAADTVVVTVNSGTPPDQVIDVNPATNMSGYVVSSNPTGRSFTGTTMNTGKASLTIYEGAAQFVLPTPPAYTTLTSAQILLTGQSNTGNTSTDQWSVKLLPTTLDANWATQSYNSISGATPDATLTPVLTGTGQVIANQVNTFSVASADLSIVQSRLAGSGKLSVRTQGDTLGSSSQVLWRSGNVTTVGDRPKLRLTFTAAAIPNQTPVAIAGRDQTVLANTAVTLDGSNSYDYESGVTYAWTPALTNPETVTLSSSTVASPTFTPTKTGQYRFSLVVTDGSSLASTADEILVNVVKELPASSTSFTYDGNGDRVLQTKGVVDTAYVVDSGPANERVLMETTASATTYYIYGHDMLYSIDTAGPHYQHTDALGSVVAITDSSGAVEQTYDYDVFGVMRSATGTSGNRYTFTGEQNDASGLVYLRARFYDPSIGRFLSRDPFPAKAADTQTLNRYVYVKNNPTNYVDPSGQQEFDESYPQVDPGQAEETFMEEVLSAGSGGSAPAEPVFLGPPSPFLGPSAPEPMYGPPAPEPFYGPPAPSLYEEPAHPYTSPELEQQHYKHAPEFGSENMIEHTERGSQFFDAPLTPSTFDGYRSNGEYVRYDDASHEFGVKSPNGQTMTYFRLTPEGVKAVGAHSGIEYFNLQFQ